jgi:hypothetical protein
LSSPFVDLLLNIALQHLPATAVSLISSLLSIGFIAGRKVERFNLELAQSRACRIAGAVRFGFGEHWEKEKLRHEQRMSAIREQREAARMT